MAPTAMTIVVAVDEADDALAACLVSVDAAVRGCEWVGCVEVVVADAHPHPRTDLAGRDWAFELVRCSAPGPVAARNAGAAAARHDLVWLLDGRSRVTPAALDRHASHDRSTGTILVGPVALPAADPTGVDAEWWYDARDRRRGEQVMLRDPRDCSFANASAPASLLREHRFDERYSTAGIAELDLAARLLDAGVSLRFDRAAAVDVAGNAAAPAVRSPADGADRVHFITRHPARHAAALRDDPGRFEYGLRRVVAGPGRGITARALTAGARLLARSGSSSGRGRRFTDLLALYGGAAGAAATGAPTADAVTRALRASVDEAKLPRSRFERWRRERLADPLRAAVLPLRIHHVHGPRVFARDRRDLLAVTIVRNGRFHVDSFLAHHRRLGIRHFVFLDNGSTDGTLELLCAQPDVTVYRTAVTYTTHENLLKRHLVERHSRQRWNVFVDIDERFDYPASDRLDARGLLAYLDHHGYTAAIAQMLDMFPAGSLADTPPAPADVEAAFPYFDITAISKRRYEYDPDPATPLESHRGGIRRSAFGSENLLTKAALTFIDDRIETFVSWHHVRGARLADISCLLRHYPFTAAFREKVEEAVRTRRYGLAATHEYEAYWSVIRDAPDLTLRGPTAVRFTGPDQLVELGFLHVSDEYRRWVDAHVATAR